MAPEPSKSIVQRRPAETAAGTTGTIVGAALIIAGAANVHVEPAVAGAITVLVGWIAGMVTRYVDGRRSAAG